MQSINIDWLVSRTGGAFIDDFYKVSLKTEGFLITHDSGGRTDHIVTPCLHRSAVSSSCSLLLTYYHLYCGFLTSHYQNTIFIICQIIISTEIYILYHTMMDDIMWVLLNLTVTINGWFR